MLMLLTQSKALVCMNSNSCSAGGGVTSFHRWRTAAKDHETTPCAVTALVFNRLASVTVTGHLNIAVPMPRLVQRYGNDYDCIST
jgi:hypothetical protein